MGRGRKGSGERVNRGSEKKTNSYFDRKPGRGMEVVIVPVGLMEPLSQLGSMWVFLRPCGGCVIRMWVLLTYKVPIYEFLGDFVAGFSGCFEVSLENPVCRSASHGVSAIRQP